MSTSFHFTGRYDWTGIGLDDNVPDRIRMPQNLHETIRALVVGGRYVVGEHATERLDERGILEWQVVDGIERGALLVERPNALPNPAIEVRQSLADGTEIKAVWSHIVSLDIAKLVTVHFFDE